MTVLNLYLVYTLCIFYIFYLLSRKINNGMATPLCYTIIIPFFTALLLVGWIHPRLVKIALLKNIVDNPDARKLQRTPVPVLGGSLSFSES